jgi:hypothetical membrane protein
LGWSIYVLGVLYFIVQFFVASAWKPVYSWSANTISNLGDTSCRPTLCSPRHQWMNAEFLVLGLVMIVGSWLIYQEFTERTAEERLAARIGFFCLAVGGVGAVLVAKFPENTVSFMHDLGAGLAIFVGTFGIFVLGIVLVLPLILRWGMRVVAPIAMLAVVLFVAHLYLGLGAGTMERIAAYPEAIWLIVFGIYLATEHHRSKVQASRVPD